MTSAVGREASARRRIVSSNPIRPTSLLGALLAAALAVGSVGGARSEETSNTCDRCHADPDFLVTNKKLYDYYQEWSVSIHKREGVECDDCHGGDSRATDAKRAHGDGVGLTDPASGIYYKNVADTCGTCHDEILSGFVESDHFAHVEKKGDEAQGPTCVTCHGAINSEVLNVNNVSASCARCHNEETDNHPENPAKARAVLNRFLSIQRFYRYIALRAEPEEARKFFKEIDPSVHQLAVTWHTFDLEKIERETGVLLAALNAKRDELRHRDARPEKRSRDEASPEK